MRRRFLYSALACLIFSAVALAANSDFPVYLTQLPNLNDYSLFANGGWDGNWYVGYDTCWIKKVPRIPPGHYARAFIGARVGRMKTMSGGPKPWDKKALPGSLYMAISSTTGWTAAQVHPLAETRDIPTEGDAENALETIGESRWFWVEIPLSQINLSGDNFLALGMSTPGFVSVSSGPVLAAGWGGKDINTWLVKGLHGAPPVPGAKADISGLSYFQPALALKLIPEGPPHPLEVTVLGWTPGSPDHLKPVVTARVKGDSVERVWLEYSPVGKQTWTRIGRFQWSSPFIFSIEQAELPHGRVHLRAAAANLWEETYASAPFTVEVSAIPKKK